ncbi:DUF692 domain-containing protein [Polymorphum gilvum]|uniref:UPF0276 protein SL003B_0850 n=1 Tax=Polymorphum gilvum (strain LMG 25793 / CGMCC 1.9160 / SL003B-26A1) TaxID=991905 RepID=F2IWI1_POLGS|nr:DUF692 domain-containing protein [Polymorphum gilvum]ADZ69280.1 Hypothetical conserved protein [Polymorphum gilvum SL003B-26A1]
MPSHRSARTATAVPRRAGVGLKPDHCAEILATRPDIGFFEVHAENYMGDGGAPHRTLEAIRRDYPLSLHGVGLSIGGEDPLDTNHLSRLKRLVERYEPGLFSEHLAWSSHDTVCYNDLLPVPYDALTLGRVAEHVDQVQERLGRPMLLENPSTYVAFERSTMSELEFLSELVRRTGCGLLLDVNNAYVSAINHGRSPEVYLAAFPLAAVGEIHLGGHAPDADDEGRPLLIDAHDRAVDAQVWRLFADTVARSGPLPTLIEWDNDVPSWPVLKGQAEEADRILADLGPGEARCALA